MSVRVEHDRDGRRFTATVDGLEVYVVYRESNGTVDFVSTFTPPEIRGRGFARAVVTAGLEWARGDGREVRGSCSYVEKLLAEGAES